MFEWIISNKEWLFSGVAIAVVGVIAKFLLQKKRFHGVSSIVSESDGNVATVSQVTAGGNVNIALGTERSKEDGLSDKSIQVTDVIVSYKRSDVAILDLRVLNRTPQPVTINGIEFQVEDYTEIHPKLVVHMYLAPSAKYELDLSEMKKGSREHLVVSHYLRPGDADRFQVMLSAVKIRQQVRYTWKFKMSLSTSSGRIECPPTEVTLKRG